MIHLITFSLNQTKLTDFLHDIEVKIGFCSSDIRTVLALRLNHKFSYESKTKTIELPYHYEGENPNLLWVIDSLTHEFLHLLIHEIEDFESCVKLDNLGYNDSNGCNYHNKGKY